MESRYLSPAFSCAYTVRCHLTSSSESIELALGCAQVAGPGCRLR